MAFPQRPMVSTGSPPRPVPPISNTAALAYRAKKKKPGMVDAMGHADTAGEVNPKPNNMGRLTGPPMQKGPGQGSMFADGRKGQPQGMMPSTVNYPMNGPGRSTVQGQPQYAMPPGTPNYPTMGPGPRGVSGQAQGTHPRGVPTATSHLADGRKPMMADGNMMGNPTPIGDDDADDAPDMSAAPPDPGADAQGPPTGAGGAIVKPEAVQYHDQPQSCATCVHMTGGNQCEILAMYISPEGGCTAWEDSGAGQGGDQGLGDQTGADFTQNDQGTSGGPGLS